MTAEPDRADVLGCRIDRLTMSATLDRCDEYVARRGFAQHMAINAAKLVAMQDDPSCARSSTAASSSTRTGRPSSGRPGCSGTRSPSASPAST
jgi:UDP-N-acetyl-D-mannosaminuronic acid transferase (WecB/TagA/CpsF family)